MTDRRMQMGSSFFDDEENGIGFESGGYQPIYHGAPVAEDKRREERVESKQGKVVLTGKDLTEKRRDRVPVYALLLGLLSIFCIFFSNGYLISMLGLLIAARAFNSGTARKKTAVAAVICCVLAILLYIICVAAKPILMDMEWYNNFMDGIGRYWPL